MKRAPLSRRDFLNAAAAAGFGGLLAPASRLAAGMVSTPHAAAQAAPLPEFPQAERLGRVLGGKVEVKARPDVDSPTVKELMEDTIVVWGRERVGSRPLWYNQRYLETPDGYIYAPNVQPVWNRPNAPLNELPEGGMWVEVTVPYVDLLLANPPARSPWLEHTATPRLYYSQILWVDQLNRDESGQVFYRVSDRYGGFGDFFWAAAEAFRPLAAEDYSPIRPEAADKLVHVDVTRQTLSCLEGSSEVYFCRVSTGPKLDTKADGSSVWATPPGKHTIWRKLVSVHMTGGTTGGGYDLPGIGWTTLFSTQGIAIHSTFWHNNFGLPQSHGCVNCTPDDALWVFRWTLPDVPTDTGDITVAGGVSTKVLVYES